MQAEMSLCVGGVPMQVEMPVWLCVVRQCWPNEFSCPSTTALTNCSLPLPPCHFSFLPPNQLINTLLPHQVSS